MNSVNNPQTSWEHEAEKSNFGLIAKLQNTYEGKHLTVQETVDLISRHQKELPLVQDGDIWRITEIQ